MLFRLQRSRTSCRHRTSPCISAGPAPGNACRSTETNAVDTGKNHAEHEKPSTACLGPHAANRQFVPHRRQAQTPHPPRQLRRHANHLYAAGLRGNDERQGLQRLRQFPRLLSERIVWETRHRHHRHPLDTSSLFKKPLWLGRCRADDCRCPRCH